MFQNVFPGFNNPKMRESMQYYSIKITRWLKKSLALLTCTLIIILTGCAGKLSAEKPTLSPDSITGKQLLVAVSDSRNSTTASVYTLERTQEGWKIRTGPLPAMTGRNGFAPPGEKREGDGRAPTGIFSLESAFGYPPFIKTKMPYRQATDDDLWVDDVNSPDYNTWVKRGATNASSFEVMKLKDRRYTYGIVTGYNRNPVVKGHGSAIFIHVWLTEGYKTSGCVALAPENMLNILEWLSPEANPQILMGARQDLPFLDNLLIF